MAAQPAEDDKAQRILEAARGLFSRYGYRRTAVEDIAREAGIAKGTVYLYFASKRELFRALSRHLVERVLAASTAAAQAAGGVEARALGVLEAKFAYFYEIALGSPHARELTESKESLAADVFARGDRRYQALLAAVLAEAEARGELALAGRELSPSEAAALLIRCADGQAAPGPEGRPAPLVVYRRRLARMARVLLAGLGAASPR